MKIYNLSIIVGKFLPPHLGHNYLIDTALSQSERVVVVVVDSESVPTDIPLETRVAWLQEIHPKAEVTWRPNFLDDADSLGWANWTVKEFGKPDAVFTSEEYGERWAKFIGCEHVLVDLDRIKFPVSGTVVRENPYKYWEWMHPIVRAWYVKRVALVGVESTGKTTLAKILAKHYKTVCVPEYGRIFYEGFSEIDRAPEKWVPTDLVHIGNIQKQVEDYMTRKSGPIMICDTDVFATQLWNWRYYKNMSPELDTLIRPADLYLVCGDEIPFEQDGFRLDDLAGRSQQQNMTIRELIRRQYNYQLIAGTLEDRVLDAVLAIDRLIL